MAVVRIDDLRLRYGAFVALDGLSVELPGGAMGLLGPNGAGKTSLLKALLGLVQTNSGRAEVLGIDPVSSPLALRQAVGYMPESDCYIPRLSGAAAVAFAGELSGLTRRDSLKRAHEVLYYVGLEEVRYRKVDDYSQGMRQRLRLAQALVHDPDLLFLDEPTSGLDPKGRTEMLALISDLARNHGKHILVSTHLLSDAEEVCDSAVVLRSGRIAATGSIADLTAGERGRYEVRIRGDVDDVLSRLSDAGFSPERTAPDRFSVQLSDGTTPLFLAARDSGAQVRELEETSFTLEEAFLRSLSDGGRS